MKKLLLIFFLLFATIASAQKYTATDTIKTTLSTSRYTSVSLGSGDKTIHLQNTATSVLLIGFSNGRDLADTVNIYRLNPGNWIHFYERVAKYMYLFTGAADAITTTISYGSGLDYLIERTDANGVTVTNPVGIDTVRVQSMTGQSYFDIRNSWDWTRYKFACRDTVQTGQDTLSRLLGYADTSDNVGELGITEWWQVIITPSDTIQVSSNSSFPSTETWILYPNESWTSEKFNASYTVNLFFKTLFTGGHTGSAEVRKRLWGF